MLADDFIARQVEHEEQKPLVHLQTALHQARDHVHVLVIAHLEKRDQLGFEKVDDPLGDSLAVASL